MVKLTKLAPVLLLIFPSWTVAQERFPISELSFDGIYATRTNDPVAYCLLGGNACIFPGFHSAWSDDPVMRRWLRRHPKAFGLPVSTQTFRIARDTRRTCVYLWIEDGHESLNVALVREGRYPAGTMGDMVDADRALHAIHVLEQDPRMAQVREQVAKQRGEMPDDEQPHRLVSEENYAQMMRSLDDAEATAQNSKKGMWADSGLKGRSPPSDEYLAKQYRRHKDWFERIRTLLAEEPRLADINQKRETQAKARTDGVDAGKVEKYRLLVSKLSVNEELTGVYDIGQVCLIVSDIEYGLFDNGVIKGYVYAPTAPTPLVQDLDRDPGETTLSYRPLADNWFLFEVHH